MAKVGLGLLVLLLPLVVPSAAATEPSVATSVTVAAVGLPAKKAGRREILYAFGKDAALRARSAALSGLRRREAFREVVDEGPAGWTLQLDILEASQSFDDRSALASSASRLVVTATLSWTWARGEEPAVSGTFESRRTAELDRAPWRDDLSAAWQLLLEDAAAQAFSKAWDQGVFGDP